MLYGISVGFLTIHSQFHVLGELLAAFLNFKSPLAFLVNLFETRDHIADQFITCSGVARNQLYFFEGLSSSVDLKSSLAFSVSGATT